MSKTVAIVINTSWNIYNFRVGLLNALKDDGYRIVCIAPKDEYSFKLEEMGFEYYDIEMNNKGTNPFEDVKLLFSFYRLYKRISPDVILQYTIKPNIYGSMAAGLLGLPVISNISGLGTVFLNDGLSSKVAKFLYGVALRVPKKVFYQNSHDRDLFIDSNLVEAKKTDLLAGSGIDTKKFKPINIEIINNIIRFLFIARLVKDKGIVEFVEAAKIMSVNKNLEFHILGSYYPGNPTAISEQEMKKWQDDGIVKYIGTSDAVQSVIANYDCVVLPSYREGLSRVLLEAASMEKPIITTDVPGCREVVDDGINGYLCRVKDADSLARQIKKMSKLTNAQRVEMGKKGRIKVIAEFDESMVIEKYKEAIALLLS